MNSDFWPVACGRGCQWVVNYDWDILIQMGVMAVGIAILYLVYRST